MLDQNVIAHPISPDELFEEVVLKTLTQNGDTGSTGIGQNDKRIGLARGQRCQLRAIRRLLVFMDLIASDRAAFFDVGCTERRGQTNTVIVVHKRQCDAVDALGHNVFGKDNALVRIRRRGPEDKIFIFKSGDFRRGRSRGYHHNTGRYRDVTGGTNRRTRAERANDGDNLFDVDEFAGSID